MSDSVQPHRRQRTRLPHPWDSPGKNTGVGCHFLLQYMKVKVKSLSRIRLFTTPWSAAYQAPPSMGFSRQEYWSEWVTISFSGGSSQPRDQTRISCTTADSLLNEPPKKPKTSNLFVALIEINIFICIYVCIYLYCLCVCIYICVCVYIYIYIYISWNMQSKLLSVITLVS